jgi:hemerythrin
MCGLVILTCFINGIPLNVMILKSVRESEALRQLIHVDEESNDMEFLEVMMTQIVEWDFGRKNLFEKMKQLLDGIQEKVEWNVLEEMMGDLMKSIVDQFKFEEEFLAKNGNENIKKHSKEHLLIRQRVTNLFDLLRLKDEATVSVASYMLQHIFDKHFVDDVEYVMNDNGEIE